ncbi:MAG: hypothetical protein HY908_37700 [Myxococcales bacterium]|nr:hypothetical protein [Myxococcales bacterium]
MTLRQSKPRPRTAITAPSYPRALGLVALGMLTACAGTVQVEGETTASDPIVTGSGGSGAGGYGVGGGLDGGMPEPFGGSGGAGATAGAGGAGASAGAGGVGAGGYGDGGYGYGGGLDGGIGESFGGAGGAGAAGGAGGAP